MTIQDDVVPRFGEVITNFLLGVGYVSKILPRCTFPTLLWFFTSLALNAAKSPTPFGRQQHQLQAWWSFIVEEAVGERVRILLLLIDDRQVYFSDSRHARSVIAKIKDEAWQATSLFFLLNLTLNLCILSLFCCWFLFFILFLS